MGPHVISERSEQKKIGLLYAELLHSVPCVSRKFATKNIPQFLDFLLAPTFSSRHLPPAVNRVDASGRRVWPICDFLKKGIWL